MRRRPGFTLIELLLVVLIIGILAALAIPRYQTAKARASSAGLKSDLHNLSLAEEAYFATNSRYTSDLAALQYTPSPGTTVDLLATDTGWSAAVSNPVSDPLICAMFRGQVAPVPPATTEGMLACQ